MLKDNIIGGIDEANKGECLNSLIVCLVYSKNHPNVNEIPYYGESKNRTYKDEELKQILKKHDLRYAIIQWPPAYIDKYNVNYLLYLAQVYLIKRYKVTQVHIDSIVPEGPRINKLMRLYRKNKNTEFFCAPKLDRTNTLVGLASLIAKNRKFYNLRVLEQKVGQKVGSGNLNDMITKNYIVKNYPKVVNLRSSWPLNFIPGLKKHIKQKSKFL